jgi:beta-phosphoglucomutase
MDGVLVDTYHAHYESWLTLTEEMGRVFTEAEFASTFGLTSRQIIAAFWGENRLDDKQIAVLDAKKEDAFRQIIEADFPAMPGAAALLRQLHDAGFRLAVGSSGPPENVNLVLDRLDVRQLFGAVVTGRDVTRGKPDPQVFLTAAQRLQVAPDRCVVVEDAPGGVAAAKAAAMANIGLTSTGRSPQMLEAADLVVGSLSELSPEVFRRLIDEPRG